MCGLAEAGKASHYIDSSAIPLMSSMVKCSSAGLFPRGRARRHSSSLPFCYPQFCP
jgi:hypothetical protein